MKRFILVLSGIIITAGILAQTPQGISHQAVMRDAENNLIVESPIGLQVSIIQGAHDGEAVYVEIHNVISNPNGLITYIIGEGDVVDGIFEEIDWADGPYFLKTEADPAGGTSYSIGGVMQFLSVPYAFYAVSSGDGQWKQSGDHIYFIGGNVGIGESSPQGKLHVSVPGEWLGVVFTGTGLNDLEVDVSGYNNTGATHYAVRIENTGPTPNLIEISNDGGTAWIGPLEIAPEIDIGFGVTINFGSLSGYTYGDRWDWTVNESFEDVFIIQDDKLGIGTSQPSQLLDINGNIRLRGVNRSLGTWSAQGFSLATNGSARVTISSLGNVGIGTGVPAALLHAAGTGTGGGNVLFTGLYKSTSPGNPPASGAGTRMMWYPDKAAFRAGRVLSVNWDKHNIGDYSFSTGYNTRAQGSFSSAMGNQTIASGSSSTAMGSQTTASGSSSTAMGNSSEATGFSCTAMGYNSNASGNTSTAMGNQTLASGYISTSMGDQTKALGSASTAMGNKTTAWGSSSTAMGNNTNASGHFSTAAGRFATASGDNSIAMGYYTTASANYSIAMGMITTASGNNSTALGRGSRAVGDYSFAINLSSTTGVQVGTRVFAISGALAIGGNTAWSTWSDMRLKKDIQHLEAENNLDKVMKLRGVRFRWDEAQDGNNRFHLGFMAQDVLDILPEPVLYDELNDIYSIEYTALIPVLVEAIKEQQSEIELLKQDNSVLKARLDRMESILQEMAERQ